MIQCWRSTGYHRHLHPRDHHHYYHLHFHLVPQGEKKNVSVFYSRYVSSIVINSCFRFVTILYYLNDVEEGGQTAFLIADNMTTTPDVSISNHRNFLPPSSLTMCALLEQVCDLNIESKIPDSTVFYRS